MYPEKRDESDITITNMNLLCKNNPYSQTFLHTSLGSNLINISNTVSHKNNSKSENYRNYSTIDSNKFTKNSFCENLINKMQNKNMLLNSSNVGVSIFIKAKKNKQRFVEIIRKLNNDKKYTNNILDEQEKIWESNTYNKSYKANLPIPIPKERMKSTLAQLYERNKSEFHKRKGMVDSQFQLEYSEKRSKSTRYTKILKLNPKVFYRINGEFTNYAEKLYFSSDHNK